MDCPFFNRPSGRAKQAYLLLYIVERVGRIHGKTDQDDVGIWIGQRAEAVVIFLTRGIPERQFNVFAIDLNIGDIILEDGGNVDLDDNTFRLAIFSLVVYHDLR